MWTSCLKWKYGDTDWDTNMISYLGWSLNMGMLLACAGLTVIYSPYSTGVVYISSLAIFCTTTASSPLFLLSLLQLPCLFNKTLKLICIEDKLLYMIFTNFKQPFCLDLLLNRRIRENNIWCSWNIRKKRISSDKPPCSLLERQTVFYTIKYQL